MIDDSGRRGNVACFLLIAVELEDLNLLMK